jgi:hypothetical protein
MIAHMRGANCPIWLVLASAVGLAGSLTAQTPPRTNPLLTPTSVEYTVEKSHYLGDATLRAKVDGKSYTLIDKSKEQCLEIVDQRDWDGNGLKDALVERITACGGNCCPNSFFFVTAFPHGRFEISTDLADSWKDPTIERWKDRWSVVIVSDNEGWNTDRPVEITRRFVVQGGKAEKVEESQRRELPALVEIRSEIFKADGEEHRIQYDLDGDGKKDTINGKLWERWGRLMWSVRFATGKQFSSSTACKRIGVLATKTRGVNDLVCDQDAVLHWTGQKYR